MHVPCFKITITRPLNFVNVLVTYVMQGQPNVNRVIQIEQVDHRNGQTSLTIDNNRGGEGLETSIHYIFVVLLSILLCAMQVSCEYHYPALSACTSGKASGFVIIYSQCPRKHCQVLRYRCLSTLVQKVITLIRVSEGVN